MRVANYMYEDGYLYEGSYLCIYEGSYLCLYEGGYYTVREKIWSGKILENSAQFPRQYL